MLLMQDVVRALHNDLSLVKSHMNTLLVGRVVGSIDSEGCQVVQTIHILFSVQWKQRGYKNIQFTISCVLLPTVLYSALNTA